VVDLLGMLKENFRGAFVEDDVVADGLGCAEGVFTVWDRLIFIEFKPLGLGNENDC
jgi:hypothetical protein